MTSTPALPLMQRLREISEAVASAGEPLPAEPALAEALGVSRAQLREVLARLEFEGFLTRRRRTGTFVNAAALDIRTWMSRQEPFIETLRSLGFHDASIEVVHLRFRPLDADESEYFEQPAGLAAIEVRKRWRGGGQIRMVADYVVPAPGARSLDDIDRPADPIFTVAQRLLGSAATWEVAHTRATNAEGSMARDAELPGGAPLLVLDLLGVSASGLRLYRTMEHHVEGAVDFGFVRTIQRPTP